MHTNPYLWGTLLGGWREPGHTKDRAVGRTSCYCSSWPSPSGHLQTMLWWLLMSHSFSICGVYCFGRFLALMVPSLDLEDYHVKRTCASRNAGWKEWGQHPPSHSCCLTYQWSIEYEQKKMACRRTITCQCLRHFWSYWRTQVLCKGFSISPKKALSYMAHRHGSWDGTCCFEKGLECI